ncbi:hypothetical protein B0A48_02816 [Cryoendolithus antarcticus]|uniref:tRNA ligase n=1 Tax=Cryoendolithus antarcticus TaxID=1507870 RepID=A0A1V8TLD7_9PEZI|nr:hypothetical protein B0A48_02816 [Cryoendolithus antarcticus]
MARAQDAPFRPQDHAANREMLRGLEAHKGSYKKRADDFSAKKSTFSVTGSFITVDSWRMQDWDYKKPNLPTYARGLFTTKNSQGQPEIAVRGYDKFFNEGEVPETEFRNAETQTRGPYELSVKENGCIIFMAGLEDGTLIVCSKHSTGARTDIEVSHADVGDQWVEKHLASVGKTRQDFARVLRELNVTAVAELCDDDFEEHVLRYKPEAAGLYLHGLNLNVPDFATYPHHLVDKFADEWGMKRTMYLVKDDIEDVKNFLRQTAETGNYDGRDTEGFVIRCQSKHGTREWHDWFFKYKFEEPYLMYRQWRECTKAVINGREPRYKKHKQITEEYIDFARRKLHGNRELAKQYNQNHGIIQMRDEFLESRGLSGADIIRKENASGLFSNDDTVKDIVLVPVATIGCGKTTVALALVHLFGWGHVQNDNVTVKKGKPQAFANACTHTLEEAPAMIADRNNHQKRERKQIMDDISKTVYKAKYVALHYRHDRANYDNIRKATRERVLSRGDNHQTIQAASKGNIIVEIMEGFMHRFEPVNAYTPPDDGFDSIIDLDPVATSRENLEIVITHLYNEYPKLFGDQEMPSSDDMDAAIAAAMNDYTVDIKHEIQSRPSNNNQNTKPKTPQPSPKPKAPKVEYFAVQLPATLIRTLLDTTFQHTPPHLTKLYTHLLTSRRIQTEFHVTLCHRASAGQHPTLWSHLNDLYTAASAPTPTRAFTDPDPKLGSAKVSIDRIVWDDRIMAFAVRLTAGEGGGEVWTCANRVPHVTVGTASVEVKPKESNDLLLRWEREGARGENGVWEVVLPPGVEVEGTVKAVLAR